ncbi:TPA: N-acetyl-gamma-glutamyl-phosphate reductase [bacterium]|nr:N-acetyl-gamma-glutamyl-phosphate reductase [bacterium]
MRKTEEKIRVGIIGAASLTSGVLLKLLANHRYATIVLLASETQDGQEVGDIHRFLRNILDLKTVRYNSDEVIEECDVVFFSKPHGEFLEGASDLINKARKIKPKIKFIDLSADFRLKDANSYKEWYGFVHKDEFLLESAVYGLSEVYYQEIKKAFLIANPGCYPTCTILSVAPLFGDQLVDIERAIIVEAICGVSGAGRKPNERNLAMEVEENIKPYKIGIHPHIPEIEQELGLLIKDKISALFVPHVASFKYGMLTTTYLKLQKEMVFEDIVERYREFYKNKPFIRIRKKGEYPEIQNVESTNFCDIGIQIDKRTDICIIMGCIDNLLKGAAGQAIQNMNIMFGLDETEGLPFSNILRRVNS